MNNLDADYIRRTFDLLSLVERDTQLKRIGAIWFSGPCPFCGGTDRFTLKRTADGWRWLCRHCTDDKYQDAIDYVMRRDGVDFKEAVERLGGGKPSPLRIEPQRPTEPEPKPQEQTQETRERLKQIAFDASRRIDLDDDPLAQTVRNYLYKRGLLPPTWQFALLGATTVYDPKAGRLRPAASIPYFDTGLDVMAIKHRFVNNEPDGLRYTSAKGSQAGFYYLPEHLGYCDFLLVVEGELNLLSVAQVRPELDLVSTGS
jgi:putative DNA primase/helicase